jgi:hypothetical protein
VGRVRHRAGYGNYGELFTRSATSLFQDNVAISSSVSLSLHFHFHLHSNHSMACDRKVMRRVLRYTLTMHCRSQAG